MTGQHLRLGEGARVSQGAEGATFATDRAETPQRVRRAHGGDSGGSRRRETTNRCATRPRGVAMIMKRSNRLEHGLIDSRLQERQMARPFANY